MKPSFLLSFRVCFFLRGTFFGKVPLNLPEKLKFCVTLFLLLLIYIPLTIKGNSLSKILFRVSQGAFLSLFSTRYLKTHKIKIFDKVTRYLVEKSNKKSLKGFQRGTFYRKFPFGRRRHNININKYRATQNFAIS